MNNNWDHGHHLGKQGLRQRLTASTRQATLMNKLAATVSDCQLTHATAACSVQSKDQRGGAGVPVEARHVNYAISPASAETQLV